MRKYHSDEYNIHIVLVELRGEESANVLFGSMGSGVLPVYAETLKAFRIFGSLRPIQSLPSRTGCTTQDPPLNSAENKASSSDQ